VLQHICSEDRGVDGGLHWLLFALALGVLQHICSEDRGVDGGLHWLLTTFGVKGSEMVTMVLTD